MAQNNKTSMGGSGSRFDVTPWSRICAAGQSDQYGADLKGELIQLYWRPVYCYLRRKGHSNENAKDLVQGFFQEVVLEGALLERADRGKGRFRTFLLTALDQYVQRDFRRNTAQKRLPGAGLISLANLESMDQAQLQAMDNLSPEEAFHYTWASELLEAALGELEREYRATGRMAFWKVFEARVLEPILQGAKPVSLPELCEFYAIDTPAQASNMITTVKRRFQTVLKRALRAHAQSEAEVQTEIDELIQILAKS